MHAPKHIQFLFNFKSMLNIEFSWILYQPGFTREIKEGEEICKYIARKAENNTVR